MFLKNNISAIFKINAYLLNTFILKNDISNI